MSVSPATAGGDVSASSVSSSAAPTVSTGLSSPAAANTPSKTSKAVNGCCGKNKSGITGQCCEYLSKMNAYCQQAMAPYSDSCSSCGGSGVKSGGDSGSDSSSSNSESSNVPNYAPTTYDLHFKFDNRIVNFSTSTPKDMGEYGIIGETISPNGLFRFNNGTPSVAIAIFIGEKDYDGKDATATFNLLAEGDLLSFSQVNDESICVICRYISQTDKDNYRILNVGVISAAFIFAHGDIVSMGHSKYTGSTPGIVYSACPDCSGTGLEGSVGGIDGLIMAAYNGSAEFAGSNIDIYGMPQ